MDYVMAKRFYYHSEAHVAKAALEVEGIDAHLLDEHLVGVNWLFARAVGGITLVVAPDSVSDAIEALERDDSDLLADIPEWHEPPSRAECCSSCGSSAIRPPCWGHRARVLSYLWPSLVLVTLLARALEHHQCTGCGREWL